VDLSKNDLTLIGAALYVCEGTKLRTDKWGKDICSIEFTNKDPRLILMFLRCLREIIGAEEERIKAELFVYPDLDERRLKQYWSGITQIPIGRFNQSIVLMQKNVRFKPNKLGTLKIRYAHKEHFLKLQGIINEVFGKLSGEVA